MTTTETEETVTCGGQREDERSGRGGSVKPSLSFTTLSTIAIQAGQSQIVISVLKSGSAVHLQLVQVLPGLCETGLNQEENQTLIQEQQQLMEKLKKHEKEVLAVVEKSRQTERRTRRRDEGNVEQKKNRKQEEEEEELYEAMVASLNEGWSLLLRLLERRQEVLRLASDFYCRALEFAVSIDRLEDLQIRPDSDRLAEVQLMYDSMRRDLLGKSLQVLNSGGVLLQKLRQLQRIEALQRRGRVLRDEEADEESSQRSSGIVLKLEQLMETLQDRRRRADQAVRLQLQQTENSIMVYKKEQEFRQETNTADWSLTVNKILDQNLQFGSKSAESTDLNSDSRTKENRDLQPGSESDGKPESRSEEATELLSEVQPRSGLDLKPGSRSELTIDVDPGLRSKDPRNSEEHRSDIQPGSRIDLKSPFKTDEIRDLNPECRSDNKPESRSGEAIELLSEFKSDVQSGSRSDVKPGSTSEKTSDQLSGSRSDLQHRFRLELNPGSRPEESRFKLNLQAEFRLDLKLDSESEEIRDVQPGSRLDQKPGWRSKVQSESGSDVNLESRSETTREVTSRPSLEVTKNFESGSRLDLKPNSRPDLNPGSSLEEPKNLQPASRLDETSGSRPEAPGDINPESRSEETRDLQSGSTSEAENLSLSRSSRKQEETKQLRAAAANTSSEQVAGLQSMMGSDTKGAEDHARLALLTNQRQQLLSSCERLVDKIWGCVQQGSSVLSNSSEAGRQLFEAEETLNRHLQLHTQAEYAGQDVEKMKQILDQIRALHTEWTSRASPLPPSEPSRQLSPLKALTEQLKRRRPGRTCTARPDPSAVYPAAPLNPELMGQIDLVLKELQSLNRKINSNLQLLQPYVTFLRTAQQVEEEMEKLREIYMRRPEEEQEKQEEREAGSGNIQTTSTSPLKKKQVDACWQETLQRLLDAQELGNNYIHTVSMVSGAGLNLQSVVSVVQETMERLCRTHQEVKELRRKQQKQILQQQEFCKKYQERLLKTLQDLNCVSELLDSCSLMDLGSDLQTSKLLERFSQARPHFKQLDSEVEYMKTSWETVRGLRDRLEVEELKGRAVEEEDLSELLKLQKSVNNKIHQSESILDLTSSFHLTAQQLEALLQSELTRPLTGSTGSCGSKEAELSQERERQQQIQSLFESASTLKTDICTAVNHSGWTCFRVEQLESRLLSLDSLCVSWLSEAARREEKLRRELLTCRLREDINQLRDSFKELKKRFSNLKFNYLKRNDRTRNMKAVRNQLQQVELYEEKLQALRKRLQGVTARLGSEVRDGAAAREAEDAVNELQRQMGDFERSVNDHLKTLELSRKLQQAMEEYQFWCEDASGTIARVRTFSSECRSTEAVSVLHRQFEKFVWPTVPQQDERISQITELAVRLHGVEEGQRYIEKTVSKHSDMVESIRELSDALMKLEAKLKLENFKKQQNHGEKEIKKEGRESESEEKEKNLKENRKMKKKEQTDNRSTQEAADLNELKETGHTPELAPEHDGKEVPVRRQTAANRKPPLQKSCSQEADRRTDSRQQTESETFTSSFCSTHTLSLSCSPVEANRRIHAIHSRSLPVTTEPQAAPPPTVIGPLFSDIQREFQRKEMQEPGQQGVSASFESNMMTLQDASAGGLSEAELQQQEVMTEDSLSNDEYECASPDDISLPPLAETPESIMIQSDVEESFCFSSHSIHVNQYSHQCQAQSQRSGSGTGAVRQQRESSQTESCPTPSARLHSSTRFRSESSSFVQSPVTAPTTSLLTSTLCSILKTGETSTTNVHQSAGLSLDDPELSFPSGLNTVLKSKTPDSCPNMDNNVPKRRSPSKSESLLKEHGSQYNQPQTGAGTQVKISQYVAFKVETLPQTPPVPQAAELNNSPTLPQSSYDPQPFNDPDPDLHKDKTPPQHSESQKCSPTFPQPGSAISFPQSLPDSDSVLHQDVTFTQTRQTAPPVSKPPINSLTNTSTITQQTTYSQSLSSESHHTLSQVGSSLTSPQENSLSQSETLPKINPAPKARGLSQSSTLNDSVHHQETPIPQDSSLPQAYLDSKVCLEQDVPSSQTSKEASSVSMAQSSSKATATAVTQKQVFPQSSPPNTHSSVSEASVSPRSQQGRDSSQSTGGLPEVRAPTPPEPNSFRNIGISSSTITSSRHQTAYSLHESLTSTCTQQCMHDPGMTPSSPTKPTAPPQPESQTQALTQQANPHVIPLSSPPHLLTPDQDPNICQPMAIREEITLTPQIQGPPLPAPPTLPQAQAESLPQGKASKPGHPCFTRPLSRATVMEGSPVMLEVEVTGHPEPTLTWCKDGEVSVPGPGRAPACEDRKHFLFIPEASDSGGGSYESASRHSSSDKWLMAEVFDIISVDWQTWFGALCVLLWLLYLIVL